MELVYLYIKKYKNNPKYSSEEEFIIRDKGINFSDNFKCEFKEEKLIIKKQKSTYENFYGKNVKGIKLLLGQNGVGKTTILDILGMKREDRCNDHYIRKCPKGFHRASEDKSYFSPEYVIVYHLKENKFVIEFMGNYKYDKNFWIKNMGIQSINCREEERKNMFYKLPIGFIVEYNYDENSFYVTDKHCFNSLKYRVLNNGYVIDGKKICEEANIYYFSDEFSHRIDSERGWKTRKEDDDDYLIKRQIVGLRTYEPNDFKAIYQMFCDERFSKYIEKMKLKPKIILSGEFYDGRFYDFDSEFKNCCNEKIEMLKKILIKKDNRGNEKVRFLGELIYRYYLDIFIYFLGEIYKSNGLKKSVQYKKIRLSELELKKITNSLNNNNYENATENYEINDTLNEIDMYMQVLEELKEEERFLGGRYIISRLKKKEDSIKDYQKSFEEIYLKIEELDESYFKRKCIEIGYGKEDEKVIELFDIIKAWREYEGGSIIEKIKLEMGYSSDGEKILVNLFSKIFSILRYEERKVHIIIMDEPEQRLHPEWARQFIYLITESVKHINNTVFKNSNYKLNIQLIISTHSPFLLSDVRGEDVVLLENKVEKNIRTLEISKNSPKVFSANIYDILKNEFFLGDKYIGEFAYRKMEEDLNVIRKDIKEFESIKNKDIVDKEMAKAKYIIDCIGEPILKKVLLKEYTKRKEILESSNEDNKNIMELKEKFRDLSGNEKKIFLKEVVKLISEEDN